MQYDKNSYRPLFNIPTETVFSIDEFRVHNLNLYKLLTYLTSRTAHIINLQRKVIVLH